MKIDITKIANLVLYMIENKVSYLNDKKLSIILFLIEYDHLMEHGEKIFGEQFIKDKRNPKPKIMGEIFDIIINDQDLDDDDPRLYLIQEFLEYLDIEIYNRSNFTELQFVKMEEDFDKTFFTKKELKTISNLVEKYKNETARKLANISFSIEKVRVAQKDEVII